MAIKRKLMRTETPVGRPGFLGPGHMAYPVISGPFSQSDPFIMLMDDVLDKKDNEPVGGPHPHAGFETVSLLLEGEIGDDAHTMRAGDFQLMTAGSGVVHTETIERPTGMRLLQLWLNLPQKDRQAMPRLQDLQLAHVPAISENGVSIKLYSGSLAGLVSPIKNYTPLIIADISMDANRTTAAQIPANYNGFLYVLKGSVHVGEGKQSLQQGQVGWLNLSHDEGQSELVLTAGEDAVRFVLYAGKPTGEDIVSHGPFIADTTEDIQRLYREYRQGRMGHISTAPESQRIVW